MVQVGGKRAHWRVRYWTDVLVAKGQVERKRKSKFLGYCSTTNEPTERKHRGEITIREAERLRNQLMEKVNSAAQVIQSQIPLRASWKFGSTSMFRPWDLVRRRNIGLTSATMYCRTSASCVFVTLTPNCCRTGSTVNGWGGGRSDLRNLMSSLFSKEAERVSVGKKRVYRKPRLLSDDDTERLVARLPAFCS